MNEQNYPLLEDLHVLRTATLVSIRDRAFDSLPLYYENYSDGIVSGCRLKTSRDTISLLPGIVRYGGFMYFLREVMQVRYMPTEEYCLLKLKFSMPEDSENFRKRCVTMELSPDMIVKDDEIELARFKLKAGSVLRTKYVDFFDRVTEFDTINSVYCPYAAIGRSTVAPEIVSSFAKEASAYNLEPLDLTFCLAALSKMPLSYEQISFYLQQKLSVPGEDWDNMGLYNGLCTVLRQIQNGGEREIRRMNNRRREVFVD